MSAETSKTTEGASDEARLPRLTVAAIACTGLGALANLSSILWAAVSPTRDASLVTYAMVPILLFLGLQLTGDVREHRRGAAARPE